MARYTRKQAAARLAELGFPVSPNTLWRWENSEPPKYEPPKRVVHNRQCVYTDETIQNILQFMQREEPANLVA
jgi:hypothetical protein